MRMRKNIISKILTISLIFVFVMSGLPMGTVNAASTDVFINEIHYDNDGADSGEAVEIAGPAGTDLAGWSVVLYNGSSTQLNVYDTISLSGIIPNQDNGYGTLEFIRAGIQNGSPDGLALVDAGDSVIQFLSYEGSFTAVNGPAAGMTSTDIGVSEASGSAVGDSLQLIGTGTIYEDFSWAGSAPNTFGAVNTGQSFGGGTPAGQSLPLSEGFDDCTLAGWEIISVDSDTANTWYCNATYSNIDVNGYGDSTPANEWLITPALNMNAQEYDTLTFRSYTNYTDINYPQVHVLYSTNYDGGGDPTSAAWTELTGITFSSEGSRSWVDSGEIDLSGINGTSVYFAFQYISSGTGSGSAANWRLDEINFFESTPPGISLPLSEGFDDCTLEGWEILSVDTDAAHTWYCNSTYSNIDANGYGDSAPANEWLITPAINMDAQENDTLTFRSYTRYTDINYPQLHVLYSTDYDGGGDPTSATWTELTGITFSPEDSGSWVGSGDVDLSGISGANVYFAFQYVSSGTSSGTAANWRLDEINFFAPPPLVMAKIHEVQGPGDSVAISGGVIVDAIVVADYQGSDQLSGFFIQEEDVDVDSDPNTSEGIFVYCGNCSTDVAVGDQVEVIGQTEEYFGMSQIGVTGGGSVSVLSSGNSLPTPATIDLPASTSTYESAEGMLVTFPDTLYVSEYYELARYDQLVLTADARPQQFTDAYEPSVAGYTAFLNDLNSKRIILDNDNNFQNDALGATPAEDKPYFWPRPGLSNSNYIRGGDSITNLTGVLHWSWAGYSGTDAWRVRPVEPAFSYNFTSNNERTTEPDEVGGTLKVASFNVLNYFTTINSRGADSTTELDRQRAKTAAAICAIDADVVGLIEIENNGAVAISDLLDGTNGINANCGPYAFIDTGVIGTDEITVAFIYKTSTAAPVGNFAILTSSVDTRFIDTKNRPALAQTFVDTSTGGVFTVVVNHLKSKGSDCNDLGDIDTNDGQGNCNLTRTDAAAAMVDWLASDPTGSGDPDFLIIGDLNSYRNEDPIDTIEAGADDTDSTTDDYTDLLDTLIGSSAYSYLFDGQLGYLDHALAGSDLVDEVSGVTVWHINADEIPVFDYNDDIDDGSYEASYERESSSLPIYEPNAYRSSDHDPVIIGLGLTTEAEIYELIDDVQMLMDNGVLNDGQGNALISKLENVLEKLEKGHTSAAANQLGAFINQVEDFVYEGILTTNQGDMLIKAATLLVEALSD